MNSPDRPDRRVNVWDLTPQEAQLKDRRLSAATQKLVAEIDAEVAEFMVRPLSRCLPTVSLDGDGPGQGGWRCLRCSEDRHVGSCEEDQIELWR